MQKLAGNWMSVWGKVMRLMGDEIWSWLLANSKYRTPSKQINPLAFPWSQDAGSLAHLPTCQIYIPAREGA